MTPRFADTFFYLALLDGQDQHHARVVRHAMENAGVIVTTRWVLVETANALAGSAHRPKVAAFLSRIESDPEV